VSFLIYSNAKIFQKRTELGKELEKLDAALSHRLKSIVEAYFKG
jgi:hypothetical protein